MPGITPCPTGHKEVWWLRNQWQAEEIIELHTMIRDMGYTPAPRRPRTHRLQQCDERVFLWLERNRPNTDHDG